MHQELQTLSDESETPEVTPDIGLIEGVLTRKPETTRILISLLYLRNIQEGDQGSYQCTGSNRFGTETTSEAVVTVYGKA